MLDNILSIVRKFIPRRIFSFFQPAYHWSLAFLAALLYGFPSRNIRVIGVTGTKGKSSTTEILSAILEEAGHKTALSNTIRFKIGPRSEANLFKMSMPGRFFAQRFIRQAVREKCDYLVMEMTSQGAMLYRHRFIELNALVFTNISPEHIEAHGSFEKYLDAKLSIARNMHLSAKSPRFIIVNGDDSAAEKFLSHEVERKISFHITDISPYEVGQSGLQFTLSGMTVHSELSGLFNLYNILAAASTARAFDVPDATIASAVSKIREIPGRVERIISPRGYEVVVDYAHTPDSLKKFYELFRKSSGNSSRNICVLGGTGGGRDTWKRAEMGRLADAYCAEIILTNEDPYDEDPGKIVDDVAVGISNQVPKIIMDRRLAIRQALLSAQKGDSVLITGKGTDPYIMGPKGSKEPWSDARVVREELRQSYRP